MINMPSVICIYFFTTIFITFGKFPEITENELVSIEKLRQAVGSKFTAPYMNSDAYLIKWLKGSKFDHAKAVESLEKLLEWRKETGADNLPFQDFSRLSSKYVIDINTTRDINGRIVALIPFGDWDVRRKAIQGTIVELFRYLNHFDETAAQLSFNLTRDPTSMVIADLSGFSLRQHACLASPPSFQTIMNSVQPIMSDYTRDVLKPMGYDRLQWSTYLQETIHPDELPWRFGGIKTPQKE